ncbi:MAG: hypothetical protein ACKV22_11350 [Bryobacteraceae bacterium]
MTYLITFSCYGARIHGDAAGSVNRVQHVPGTPTLEADPVRVAVERGLMAQAPYQLDAARRDLVSRSVRDECAYRNWTLLALHARTNHVHIVVAAPQPPERILNILKAYASRALNRAGLDDPGRKRWSRHGSTRYLWKPEEVEKAIAYVADRQGEPMAVYVNEDR